MDRSLCKPARQVGFDARGWLAAHQRALASRDMDIVRGLKMDIALDTMDCAKQRAYTLCDGTRVDIATERQVCDNVRATSFHTSKDVRRAAAAAGAYDVPAVCEVVRGDCLAAAIALKTERGLNPAVLNMASSRRPGGGYKTGAAAQEENIFRRSNYFQSLEDPQRIDRQRTWHYPLGPLCGVYSPLVMVFRGPEDEGYPFLDRPVPLDFIAVAAIAKPTVRVLEDGTQRLGQSDADLMRAKIALILDIALAHGHDSVVLGAFGCGAFGNPPEHVALLFREVLSTDAYRCRFKHICFAIFDDHNARKAHNPQGNVAPFCAVFETPLVAPAGAQVSTDQGAPVGAPTVRAPHHQNTSTKTNKKAQRKRNRRAKFAGDIFDHDE
ncbi:hypothetical protein pkur_cds_816 [Pandoravirus kuranda]|uniref:Microbial-type PARG catalytic domain-containing protein n=1 Tax=Pandoravirus kuranda TaxID=3019033 RepID=A0AA95EDU2_9VIRU|nr:hypothetical protein pkur_cds_816 [Pandoravirus kuranda]